MDNQTFINRIYELFDVDFVRGIFRRKTSRGSHLKGTVAGCVRPDGYIVLSIDNKSYLAHRVLIFLRQGRWPEIVDHINGDKSDNRYCNLRSVNGSINSRNTGIGKANKTGIMGVRYRASRNSYEAFWRTENGCQNVKNFSCDTYGHDAAKIMAAEYRSEMIRELNKRGAGYTNLHGVRKAA